MDGPKVVEISRVKTGVKKYIRMLLQKGFQHIESYGNDSYWLFSDEHG